MAADYSPATPAASAAPADFQPRDNWLVQLRRDFQCISLNYTLSVQSNISASQPVTVFTPLSRKRLHSNPQAPPWLPLTTTVARVFV